MPVILLKFADNNVQSTFVRFVFGVTKLLTLVTSIKVAKCESLINWCNMCFHVSFVTRNYTIKYNFDGLWLDWYENKYSCHKTYMAMWISSWFFKWFFVTKLTCCCCEFCHLQIHSIFIHFYLSTFINTVWSLD